MYLYDFICNSLSIYDLCDMHLQSSMCLHLYIYIYTLFSLCLCMLCMCDSNDLGCTNVYEAIEVLRLVRCHRAFWLEQGPTSSVLSYKYIFIHIYIYTLMCYLYIYVKLLEVENDWIIQVSEVSIFMFAPQTPWGVEPISLQSPTVAKSPAASALQAGSQRTAAEDRSMSRDIKAIPDFGRRVSAGDLCFSEYKAQRYFEWHALMHFGWPDTMAVWRAGNMRKQ